MLDDIWTADEVLALPDVPGLKFECIDGELLVTPGPAYSHEQVVFAFHRDLHAYVTRTPRVGEVLGSRADVRLDARTLVQPDVFVAPLVGGRPPRDLTECPHFLLVVEVLSPRSLRYDREVKRRKYQHTSDEYWIVDPVDRHVERWRPDDTRPTIVTDVLSWQVSGRSGPLVLKLAALFAEAFGEAP